METVSYLIEALDQKNKCLKHVHSETANLHMHMEVQTDAREALSYLEVLKICLLNDKMR